MARKIGTAAEQAFGFYVALPAAGRDEFEAMVHGYKVARNPAAETPKRAGRPEGSKGKAKVPAIIPPGTNAAKELGL